MQRIDSILSVADRYDTIVFDQWGVLHNGTSAYPQAIATITALRDQGVRMAVLSNSGKRAAPNRDRITGMGFRADAFGTVMTSGEALYQDIAANRLGDARAFYPITAKHADAQVWADGLNIEFTDDVQTCDAVLLMGLPDAQEHVAEQNVLDAALAAGKHLICSNPDRASPRANGQTVQSPGALAHTYAAKGGNVTFYGKPHPAIFNAVARVTGSSNPAKVLMVGDSLEHDIAGADAVGWDSLFVRGGLHADATDTLFANGTKPTFVISELK